MTERPRLRALADRTGILPDYIDVTGTRRFTGDATRVALLQAMGLDASTESAAEEALAGFEDSARKRLLASVRVLPSPPAEPPRVRFTAPGDDSVAVEWQVEFREEAGESHVASGRSEPAGEDRVVEIALPTTPQTGYHSLRLLAESPRGPIEAEQSFIVSPGRCADLSEQVAGRRMFGLWTNLYSIRSSRNWGVGDLGDLGDLAEYSASVGAAFVGINPLHALRNSNGGISPYCPVSRLFRNPLYIDIEAIPEFAGCREANARFDSPAFRAELAGLRSEDFVDYERLAAVKDEILRLLYQTFLEKHDESRSDRGSEYREYLKAKGRALIDYATFLALGSRLGGQCESASDWHTWPPQYRSPSSPAVETFRNAHAGEIDFHCFVQFELDRQLATVSTDARHAGLELGLYHDLALGSASDGSDTWTNPELFVESVEVGAPPDPFCTEGQTWGFPPMNPLTLGSTGYEYWVGLLRSSLAHAGMIRIDHVMGLFRQFWVPRGGTPADGAYLAYPADDLLGILALESRRHDAIIVGEDLGTVPPEVPSILRRWGILSSRVLYFEREGEGVFRSSAAYSPHALVTATTHDHAPLAGFWAGRDLETMHEIGVISSVAELENAYAEREHARHELLRRLIEEGLELNIGDLTPDRLVGAVYSFLAKTPCPLLGVSLDDLMGETAPVNFPGTGPEQHRNWSRRMGRPIEDLAADPRIAQILRDIGERRTEVAQR